MEQTEKYLIPTLSKAKISHHLPLWRLHRSCGSCGCNSTRFRGAASDEITMSSCVPPILENQI
jgi:hypothetical protein